MFKKIVVMLFFNLITSFHLLALFFYSSFTLLTKFIHSPCSKSVSQSVDDELEVASDEEEDVASDEVEDYVASDVEEDVGFITVECSKKEDSHHGSQGECYNEDLGFITIECSEKGFLVADIIHGGEALLFLPTTSPKTKDLEKKGGLIEKVVKDQHCFKPSQYRQSVDVFEGKLQVDQNEISLTALAPEDADEHKSTSKDDTYKDELNDKETQKPDMEKKFRGDDDFSIFVPSKLERKLNSQQIIGEEETFWDSFTIGSTSKSSSGWRPSIHYKDSVNEDVFSSSRRSCPAWESCTLFQQYDEEMMFYDRISAQKLDETELFKPAQVLPRSLSKRVLHKLTTRSKRSSEFRRNPYHELEAAYVAQICLTWEALNLNYKNFKRLRALRLGEDPGFPANIAQQFQQFLVLLQRYIENEPYERGRRPQVYARIRISSPKLLQVPEFKDSENDEEGDGLNTRISSVKFLIIMEDAIRTFMNFLEADKEKHHQIFTDFIKRKHRTTSVDPTRLQMLRKANKKKKMKLKDMRRSRKCLRKPRLKEEEVEILMGLIDLKVVSRVLKMSEISEEQIQWCEEKMSRVRFWEGKLQRDSTPLFFPPH